MNKDLSKLQGVQYTELLRGMMNHKKKQVNLTLLSSGLKHKASLKDIADA